MTAEETAGRPSLTFSVFFLLVFFAALTSSISLMETVVSIIEDKLQIKTFVKIKKDQVKVIVDSDKHDVELANSIMRLVQGQFDEKKYITIQFKG